MSPSLPRVRLYLFPTYAERSDGIEDLLLPVAGQYHLHIWLQANSGDRSNVRSAFLVSMFHPFFLGVCCHRLRSFEA